MADSAGRSLLGEGTTCKVSSSMGKEFGKDRMFDGSPETCWQSKEGKPQSITMRFEAPRTIQTLSMQFQGGFTPTECKVLVEGCEPGAKFRQVGTWFPTNGNGQQTFAVRDPDAGAHGIDAERPAAAATGSESATVDPSAPAAASERAEIKAADAQADGKTAVDKTAAAASVLDASAMIPAGQSGVRAQALRIVMADSTDFYGRVVVYALDVLGQ